MPIKELGIFIRNNYIICTMDDETLKEDDLLDSALPIDDEDDELVSKKKLLDDDIESADDLADDELEIDKEDLMDDI